MLNTGKAYVQHVRFVERARRLPRQEVAAALDEYLASLSEPARIGFGLTLTLLAKREKQDAQRRSFIQALSAAVASADKAGSRGRPDVTRVEVDEHGGPSASHVDGSASTPSTTSGTTDVVPFEVAMARNAEILASWVRLPAHARERAIDEHLSGLTETQRFEFRTSLWAMEKLLNQAISEHDASENRSWGDSWEDRMAYGIASLRTGQSDPTWREEGEHLRLEALVLQEALAATNRYY